MPIKWDKINWEATKEIMDLAVLLFRKGEYLGALVIEMLILEGTLSLVVGNLLTKKHVVDEEASEYWEKYPNFYTLINYYYLLTQEKPTYEKLKDINNRRNKIIHKLFFEFTSLSNLQKEAQSICEDIIVDLNKNLQEKYFPKKKYKCENCGRLISHRGKCLPCNVIAKYKREGKEVPQYWLNFYKNSTNQF